MPLPTPSIVLCWPRTTVPGFAVRKLSIEGERSLIERHGRAEIVSDIEAVVSSSDEGCALTNAAVLLELWREQHPKGHEQTMLDYTVKTPEAKSVPLFPSDQRAK
jgi:hypothetical protein